MGQPNGCRTRYLIDGPKQSWARPTAVTGEDGSPGWRGGWEAEAKVWAASLAAAEETALARASGVRGGGSFLEVDDCVCVARKLKGRGFIPSLVFSFLFR